MVTWMECGLWQQQTRSGRRHRTNSRWKQNPLKMNTKNDGAGDDQDDDDVGIGGTDDDDGEVSQNIARGVFSKH